MEVGERERERKRGREKEQKRRREEMEWFEMAQPNLWTTANGIMQHLLLSTEDCIRTGPRHSAKPAERLPKEEQSRRNPGGYASHRCGCCGFRVDWGGLDSF